MEDVTHVEGLAETLRNLPRFADPRECLLGTAQIPEREGQVAAERDPSVVTGQCGPGLRAFRIVVAVQRALECGARAGEIAAIEPGRADREQRFGDPARIVQRLGDAHGLGSKIDGEAELAADDVPDPGAPDEHEQLVAIADAFAQHSRSIQHRADLVEDSLGPRCRR